MERKTIQSGAPWEDKVGYSRAVRVGNTIEVSGTVAQENGNPVGKGNAYAQTKQIIHQIKLVLEQAGACLNDVVRTRIYVTNIADWESVGRAHGEVFGTIKPATSMVEVCKLIGPEYLVEIEASAVVG